SRIPQQITASAAWTSGVSLILIAGLWQYRRAHLAFGDQLNKLLPYKSLVTSLQNDPEFLLREYYAQRQHQIPLRSGAFVAADRPQLVVFTDFECPACYCNSLAVRRQVAEAFEGRLAVLVRHYPLCNACNSNVKSEFHQNACDAAYAAEAARLQGGETAFWQMHDLLFRNRKKLGKGLYRSLALQIGLDADLLLRDMDGENVRQIVASDIELAKKLDVKGTPAMFLDGRRITELCQGPVFWQAFAQAWLSAHQDGRDVVAEMRRELTLSGAGTPSSVD
ncbi:MAG: DsbA family protein, partial [Armatimonadota bacterium]